MRVPAAFALVACLAGPALSAHSVADRVKDAPAADVIRESLRCFERGEDAREPAQKITWYERGRVLAEKALAGAEGNADAHFAYFSNWGRIMQTEGWVKNIPNLPALQKHLDRALELDPGHADALAAQGGLYRQLPRFLGGDLEKAKQFLLAAIERYPEAVGARLELAECYLDTDRPAEARILAETALHFARAHGKRSAAARAQQILRRAREEGPNVAARRR